MVGSAPVAHHDGMFRILALLVFALCVGFPARAEEPIAPSQVECLGSVGTHEAVHSGRVRRLAEIRRSLDGELLHADLCRGGELLIYRVTLLDPRGHVRRVLLDAGSGRLMYDAR
jgi:hypothetical protein